MDNYYSIAEAAARFETNQMDVLAAIHHPDFEQPNTQDCTGINGKVVAVSHGDPFLKVAADQNLYISRQGMVLLAMHLKSSKAQAERIQITHQVKL